MTLSKKDIQSQLLYLKNRVCNCCEVVGNFFSANLIQDDNRLHDAAGFDTSITDQGNFTLRTDTVGKILKLSSEVSGVSNNKVQVSDTRTELGYDDGVFVSGVALSSILLLSNSAGDYYIGDGFFLPGPPTDSTKNVAITTDTSTGKLYTNDLSNSKKDQIGILIDGGGAAITTGYKGRFRVPYSGTITGWTILEVSETPITGSIVVDVKLGTYANYDTTPTFTTIAGSEKPTITTSEKGQDNTLTTWTTAVTVGDLIEYVVDSAATVEKVQLFIDITKS